MVKLFALGLSSLLVASALPHTDKRFERYKQVEAYEVRPGILALPRYTADGELCEVGLQKEHYSSEVIRLYESFDDKILQAVEDEIVPASERGVRLDERHELVITEGSTMTRYADYENILIWTYDSIQEPSPEQKTLMAGGSTVIVIRWKKRKCS